MGSLGFEVHATSVIEQEINKTSRRFKILSSEKLEGSGFSLISYLTDWVSTIHREFVTLSFLLYYSAAPSVGTKHLFPQT